jgi:hypothetical protein
MSFLPQKVTTLNYWGKHCTLPTQHHSNSQLICVQMLNDIIVLFHSISFKVASLKNKNKNYLHVIIDDEDVGDGAAVHVLEVVVPALGQDQAVALLLQGKKSTCTGLDSTNQFWSVQVAAKVETKEVDGQ